MTAGPRTRSAVFIDRDGTIIEDRDYLADPDDLHLLPGAAGAIAALNRAGLFVVVVTNQSGIARGFFGESEYRLVAARLEEALLEQGARLDASYHCPHGPDDVPQCDCRKPRPGMFERAAREHGLDLARSHYIGDRTRDLLAGIGAGGTGYLIEGEHVCNETELPERAIRVRSLEEAVTRLLGSPLSN